MASPASAGNPPIGGGSLRRSLTWRVATLVAATLLRGDGRVLAPPRHASIAQLSFDRAEADEEPVFRVTDNGAGFEASAATHLFEPFQRAHRNADFPGAGIGLAVARRILEQHGGAIRAQLQPGRGATFMFRVGDARTRPDAPGIRPG